MRWLLLQLGCALVHANPRTLRSSDALCHTRPCVVVTPSSSRRGRPCAVVTPSSSRHGRPCAVVTQPASCSHRLGPRALPAPTGSAPARRRRTPSRELTQVHLSGRFWWRRGCFWGHSRAGVAPSSLREWAEHVTGPRG